MFRIAVLDDEKKDLFRTAEVIKKWAEKVEKQMVSVEEFDTPESFLLSHEEKKFALLVSDVIMPGKNGTELARLVRRKGDNLLIIYTSCSEKYAMEAFGVQAVGYLKKPVEETTMELLLDRALRLYQEKPVKWITVSEKNEPVKVDICDIVCVINNKRSVEYVLQNGKRLQTVRRSGTFESSIEPLPGEEMFVQTHKSFFVNLEYVRSLKEETVLLDNGMEIPIARNRKAECRMCYMNYMFKEENDYDL